MEAFVCIGTAPLELVPKRDDPAVLRDADLSEACSPPRSRRDLDDRPRYPRREVRCSGRASARLRSRVRSLKATQPDTPVVVSPDHTANHPLTTRRRTQNRGVPSRRKYRRNKLDSNYRREQQTKTKQQNTLRSEPLRESPGPEQKVAIVATTTTAQP